MADQHRPRRKVMRIITRLNIGGPSLHCWALSHRLTGLDYDTLLVAGELGTGEEGFDHIHNLRPEGFRLLRLSRLKRSPSPLADLFTLCRLVALMREERPDIVHTHTAKAGMLGRLAAWLVGVPVVVHTFHGHVLRGYFSSFLSGLICFAERALSRRTCAIITLSESLKKELAHTYRVARAEQIHVIPLGRDLAPFLETNKTKRPLYEELQLPSTDLLIGCVGRLVPIKDHQNLLMALSLLPIDLPWRAAIVGEGPLRKKLEQEAMRLGIGARVHFLGWRADLPNLYSSFDLSVVSSVNEGTPLSIIESFAAGCPVISTRVGGAGDLFHPMAGRPRSASGAEMMMEGALVRDRAPAELAAAIEIFLLDPALKCAAGSAARKAARDYTEEKMVAKITALYEGLTKGTFYGA